MKTILLASAVFVTGAVGVVGLSMDLGRAFPVASHFPEIAAQKGGRLLSGDPAVASGEAPLLLKTARFVVIAQAQAQDQDQAQAQTPSPSQPRTTGDGAPATEPAAGNAVTSPPVVDESALRYFAARGDTARLNAEIARLRALYPTWTPPEDPLAVPENTDRALEEMWALYSQSRFADLRTAIAARKAREPDWVPPKDLIDRMEVAEKRAELVAASTARRDEDVVRIGAETPSLLTCSDADVLWRVAESFGRLGRLQRARDAYDYMLENCGDAPIRVATVQKAAEVLSYADMQELLTRERTLSDGGREFDPIRPDLARRFLAEAGTDQTITVAPAYLRIVEQSLAEGGLATDALLLGWYHLRRDEMAAAEPFFRKARAAADSASASQGLALVLLSRRMPVEAEAVMYDWRDASDDARATYLAATATLLGLNPPPVIAQPVLGRIARATLDARDPRTAEQFGWYALAMNQPKTASEWFEQALVWRADSEPAAYGLAVARLRLDDRLGLAALKRDWAARSTRIDELGTRPAADEAQTKSARDPLTARAVADETPRMPSGRGVRLAEAAVDTEASAEPARGARRAAAGRRACRTTQDAVGLPPAQALVLGWCLMDIDRPLEAAKAFEVALGGAGKTRSDAAYGQSLAYLRAGLTGEAGVAATRARMDEGRRAELQAALLADRAISSFRAGRYRETILFLDQRTQFRPEPTNLMVLRAFALKNLGQRLDARRMFEALGETGERDAIRQLADIRSEERRW
ncbi:cellulose synthase [Ensifer soli]|uniref:cellulose synthase n=1 Tax=Ciceribacter sp. sgz301302 TaxID=3342379 RepID=UPI0035B9E353